MPFNSSNVGSNLKSKRIISSKQQPYSTAGLFNHENDNLAIFNDSNG